MVDYTRLRTVKQLAAEAPCFTEGKLRWWLNDRDINGLKRAVIKIDGRVYIDVPEFQKWLESQREAPRPEPEPV